MAMSQRAVSTRSRTRGIAGKGGKAAQVPAAHREGPRWRRRKEARPAELLDAALEVFVERGYSLTRLEDVARRAGITKGAMYHYFENKEALFKAMIRAKVVENIAAIEQIVQDFQGSAREMLVLLMTRWWERVVEGPTSGIAKLVMGEVASFPELAAFYYEEVMQRNSKLFEHAMKLGMARGEFRRLDPLIAVKLSVAPMLVAALWKHSFATCVQEATFDPRRYFEAHLDLFLNGLLSPEAPEARNA
jgi:AcrR family transcriptional regulator